MAGTPKVRARIQALGCRGKLSQATSTASRPPRSPEDGADQPEHARRQSKLPPTPIDTPRPPEPPQPAVFSKLWRRKRRRHLVLLAQRRSCSTGFDPNEVTSSSRNPDGPCPRTRTIAGARGAHPHLGFQLDATVAEQPPPARAPGANRPTPPLQTHRGRHRPTGHASVAGRSCRSRGRRGRQSGRPGHDVVWGGKLSLHLCASGAGNCQSNLRAAA